MTLKELADHLGVTWTTAKKRYTHLKEKGIIRNPIALYDPFTLGLQRISVLAFVPSVTALKRVEKSCDIYPYTNYRSRLFGGRFGIFIQYDIPYGSSNLLNEFLTRLQNLDLVLEYELYENIGLHFETYPDLTKFNSETHSWDFSWPEWFSNLSKVSEFLPETPSPLKDYSKFRRSHFNILRALTANASVKQRELREKFHLSRTEAHRQYNFVLNNYIDRIRLIYKREIFDITETYLAICSNVDGTLQAQFYNSLKENSPPFHLGLSILQDNYIQLWGNMSPAQAISLSYSIWQSIESCQIFILNTKDEGSFAYWFYPNNFDFEKGKWNVSKGYMVNDPIRRLEEEK